MMIVKLALLIVLITAALGANAAKLPPEIADCKLFKLWQFSTSNQGWRPDHNVSRFKVKDGILSFTNTGNDPWIVNAPPGNADTSSYHFLGIKMRSSVSGSNQVYFGTDSSPFGEQTVMTYPVRGDGKWHFYEIDLSQLKTWTGKLTTLRLDPVNGGSEVGAKVDIDWIALYQVPARIIMGRPSCGTDDKGKLLVSLPIRNVGGEQSQPELIVRIDDAKQQVEPIQPRETRNLSLQFSSGVPRKIIAEMNGKTIFDVMLCDPRINRLELYKEQANFGPLATLAYKDRSGAIHYMEIGPDAQTQPWRAVRKVEGGEVAITWRFDGSESETEQTLSCELTSTVPLDILRFEGPRLIAGSGKIHALFPGLEYLEANEPSSAAAHIGPKLADRHVPHPYKITVPVMAVETKDGVIGMSWDPLREWAPGHALPCAEFESPGGADPTLMTLFVPSIPDFVDESQEFAKTPYILKPGQKISLNMTFFIRPKKKITDVIPDYYASHGFPKAPPIANGVEGAISTCLKAYTESLYSKDAGGWKSHFGIHDKHSFRPNYAAVVLGESLRKSNPDIARKCGLDPNAQLTQYTGTTLDWFTEPARLAADAAISKEADDGGFPYSITDEQSAQVKDYAQKNAGIDATALGTTGSTNSGLIARALGALLDYAVRTGDKPYVDAALRGLKKLNSFTVPRGAQTWEVHAHTPDIYAAGLAVDCNIQGYYLTGDTQYLDHAKFWAQTGLPFVYSWVPPINPVPAAVLHFDENGEGKNGFLDKPSGFYTNVHRQINPGTSIAVFGTSFYFVNWFGTPVQWCGLAWANSVRHYLGIRPDPVLQAAADMVFASGTQQQFDKGFAAGTYPDSWSLTGNTANTAFIAPDTILPYAYSLVGEKTPNEDSTAEFALRSGRACLNTFARIESFRSDPDSISATLKYFANQDLYSVLAPVDAPASVTVDGATLTSVTDLKPASSGYFYDSAARALHIKYRAQSRTARVEVKW